MASINNDVANRQTTDNNAQEEANIYEDETNLIAIVFLTALMISIFLSFLLEELKKAKPGFHRSQCSVK